ncbi:MAG: penicillin-binding protein [Bacilli bacterium]|nr:penicillin-binding protein [Bacilli bacterium]
MKRRQKSVFKINSLVLILSFFLVLIIGVRMVQLSLCTTIDGTNLKKFASSRMDRTIDLPASRGTIYDQNGDVLAQNILSYTVIAYLDPKRSENQTKLKHVEDKVMTAEKLAPIINMDSSKILELLNRDVKQVELGPGGRGITELTKSEIESLELPGIGFMPTYKRYYPNGKFSSYTIGYAKTNDNGEIIGELGIESFYNEKLKGTDGYLRYQRDRNGYQIPNTKEFRVEPIDGNDIYLTIDRGIQLIVEDAVRINFETYQPTWMLAVVAEAKTGKILAATSYPSFNPNIRDLTNYLDPVVSYAFEPGSTMKTFTYMAAMDSKKYNGSDTFMSGSINIYDDTIRDWKREGWGLITYDRGFALSSNVGVTNLVQKYINKKILKDYFLDLGFGSKTDIELPNEQPGKIDFKYDLEVATAGFGQGITTTPIQHIQALTSIANNGIMLKPYIIDKIVDQNSGEVIYQGTRQELKKVASLSTVNQIKDLLYGVIHDVPTITTGSAYKVNGVDLIGKTGTAQIADGKGGYLSGSGEVIRSFAGMYPKDDPEIIIYVAARKPTYGDSALIIKSVKKIVEDTATYLGIINNNTNSEEIINYNLPSFINKETNVVTQLLKEKSIPNIIIGTGDKIIDQYPKAGTNINTKDKVFLITNNKEIIMPNIIGWSSKEVMTLIKILGINYNIDGYGFVVEQSISPETKINFEEELVVKLKPKFNFE